MNSKSYNSANAADIKPERQTTEASTSEMLQRTDPMSLVKSPP